jgi:hypothetical protein
MIYKMHFIKYLVLDSGFRRNDVKGNTSTGIKFLDHGVALFAPGKVELLGLFQVRDRRLPVSLFGKSAPQTEIGGGVPGIKLNSFSEIPDRAVKFIF